MNGFCERCGIHVPDGGGRFCVKHGGIPVKPGFEDDPEAEWLKVCLHQNHEPPQHMVIPPGKIYRHVCPGCSREVIVRPPMIHW